MWSDNNIPDLTGLVVVVTGANSGLGYETALKCAAKGARVFLACRDLERGSKALAKLKAVVPSQ